MLSFGPYKIHPISLKYSKENRWSVVECIGRMPSLQNIGQGIESIDLEGTIYLHNLSNVNRLEDIREAEKKQTAHVLVDNLGNILGKFIIARLEEKQISFFPYGLPRKVEFNLSLKSYS